MTLPWNVPNQVYDKRGSNLRNGNEVFDLIQLIQVHIVISLGVCINWKRKFAAIRIARAFVGNNTP